MKYIDAFETDIKEADSPLNKAPYPYYYYGHVT